MRSPKILISHDRLKALVHYDPETGIFTALTNRQQVKIGQRLGSINGKGYRNLMLDMKTYRANRLAWFYMTGEWPFDMVDHEDRDKLNDRWKNLRAATGTENGRNTNLSKRNTSGHKGVMWYKRHQKWTASIRVDGKLLHIGYFSDLQEAIAARRAAEIEHFREFAA